MSKFEPNDSKAYTSGFDAFYSRFSGIYDFLVKHTPLWNAWIGPAIPHIHGPRVLEVSFGTGWLLSRYAGRFDSYGIDLNEEMIRITSRNLQAAGIALPLQRAVVEALPYGSEVFDTVVNTMAFSGYPRADDALSEIRRVLKPGARLVLIDVGVPADGNWAGRALARFVEATGDILRDMAPLFTRHGFAFSHEAIGGFGAVQLYVAAKK